MTTRRPMQDEDANAEIERLQQLITLKLQLTDENYAKSHHITVSRIMPALDRFQEASNQIWERSKIWLYFFNATSSKSKDSTAMDDDSTFDSTNRPRIDDSTMNWRSSNDMTSSNMTDFRSLQGRLRRSLQQPLSTSSLDTSDDIQRRLSRFRSNNQSPSTISTDSSDIHHHSRLTTSPPRTINFGMSPSQLQRTPIREASILLTEDKLRSAGVRSSDDDDDIDPFTARTTQPAAAQASSLSLAKPSDSSSNSKPWETSNMDVETDESRAKFQKFFENRQRKFKDMSPGKELDTIREPARSPSNRESRTREIGALVSTPTMQRVINNKQFDLRQSSPLKRSRGSDTEESDFRGSSFDFELPSGTGEEDLLQQQDEAAAIEFSDTLPQDEGIKRYKQVSIGDNTTSSSLSNNSLSMRTGTTSRAPLKFGLQHFSESFRTPPTSTQLTRVYNVFDERPGEMLTLENVINVINDTDYSIDRVSVLIDVLKTKKFLKKVGDRNAWVVRK